VFPDAQQAPDVAGIALQVSATQLYWQPGNASAIRVLVKLRDSPRQQQLLAYLANASGGLVAAEKRHTLVSVAAPVFSFSTGQVGDAQ
jgi:hypothetical protein